MHVEEGNMILAVAEAGKSRQPKRTESVDLVEEGFSVVHNVENHPKTTAWIGYNSEDRDSRMFTKNLERCLTEITEDKIVCFYEDFRVHGDLHYIQQSLDLATVYILILDRKCESTLMIQQRNTAIQTWEKQNRGKKLIFVKREIFGESVFQRSVEAPLIDFTGKTDYEEIKQSQEIYRLICTIMDLSNPNDQWSDAMFIGASSKSSGKGMRYNVEDPEFLSVTESIVKVEDTPKLYADGKGLTVKFETSLRDSQYYIQKSQLTMGTKFNLNKTCSLRHSVWDDVRYGTFVNISSYSQSSVHVTSNLPMMLRVTVDDQKLRGFIRRNIRVLYSSTTSPVGAATWTDVTDDVDRRCMAVFQHLTDGNFQFTAKRLGTYLLMALESRDAPYLDIANRITSQLHQSIVRICFSYDFVKQETGESKNENRTLQINLTMTSLEQVVPSEYNNAQYYYVDAVNGQKLGIVTKFKCGNRRAVFPVTVTPTDGGSLQYEDSFILHDVEWSLSMDVYNDDNYEELLVKFKAQSERRELREPEHNFPNAGYAIPGAGMCISGGDQPDYELGRVNVQPNRGQYYQQLGINVPREREMITHERQLSSSAAAKARSPTAAAEYLEEYGKETTKAAIQSILAETPNIPDLDSDRGVSATWKELQRKLSLKSKRNYRHLSELIDEVIREQKQRGRASSDSAVEQFWCSDPETLSSRSRSLRRSDDQKSKSAFRTYPN